MQPKPRNTNLINKLINKLITFPRNTTERWESYHLKTHIRDKHSPRTSVKLYLNLPFTGILRHASGKMTLVWTHRDSFGDSKAISPVFIALSSSLSLGILNMLDHEACIINILSAHLRIIHQITISSSESWQFNSIRSNWSPTTLLSKFCP